MRNKEIINAEGQDHFPIRLPRNRMALLVLPRDFREDDAERITKWLKLIADGGADNLRLAGPPTREGGMP